MRRRSSCTDGSKPPAVGMTSGSDLPPRDCRTDGVDPRGWKSISD